MPSATDRTIAAPPASSHGEPVAERGGGAGPPPPADKRLPPALWVPALIALIGALLVLFSVR